MTRAPFLAVLLAGCVSCQETTVEPLRLCATPGPTVGADRAVTAAAGAWHGLVELSCVRPHTRLYWSARRRDGEGLAVAERIGGASMVTVYADAVGSGLLVGLLTHELGHVLGLCHRGGGIMAATMAGPAVLGVDEWLEAERMRAAGVVGPRKACE
jgi:hypothetical protein